MMATIHTDKGKARIDGVQSDVCDEWYCDRILDNFESAECSVDAPLLGVAAKVLAFSGASTGTAYAGSTLVGQGTEPGRIYADIFELPGTLLGEGEDQAVAPRPVAPASKRVNAGR
jgi:hypothetical protein